MLELLLAAASPIQADQTARPDSIEIHRAMVSAQRNFESTRRRLLPISTAGTGRCDERVGRFCYWYDPTEPPPPEEPQSIREEREEFLAELAEAGARVPGDEWILSQRVRYLVEQGSADSALALARDCTAWWCSALEGFVLHVQGAVRAAELAFDSALAAMPEAVRCDWNDIEVVLEPEDRKTYDELDCTARDSANAALFWRATPLFSRNGNDTRTEWFARKVLVRALHGAITHHGMRLGGDLEEMLLRYGWATAYGRRPNSYAPVENVAVVGHEPKPAYPFLSRDEPGLWPPQPEHPRARFAPVFARRIAPLDNLQVARFRRGDSLLVIAGFQTRSDSLFQAPSDAVLALSSGPGLTSAATGRWFEKGGGVLRVQGPAGLLSLEIRDSAHQAWSAYREAGVDLPEAISDLLLTSQRETLPESLTDAAGAAWPGHRIPLGSVVGLFWESYGHGAEDSLLAVHLTVEPVRPGFFGRIGQSLGLRRKVPPLRLGWSRQATADAGTMAHAVEVDLSRLTPGSYLLRVEMGSGRKTERGFEIVRSDRVVAQELRGPESR